MRPRGLAALHSLKVLDSGPEAALCALVPVASLVCGTPISLIGLVDPDRQWFKANVGLPGASETPRDVAFCALAILGDCVFEVPGARQDPRLEHDPLVTAGLQVRFYAGSPIQLSDGCQSDSGHALTRSGKIMGADRRPGLLPTGHPQARSLRITRRRPAGCPCPSWVSSGTARSQHGRAPMITPSGRRDLC
jgi:hypothetical protein